MSNQKLHLHSMMVHSVAALAPLAAIAFIFLKQGVILFTLDAKTWSFLIGFSIFMMFLISLPSILSGIFERGHVYAKWHSTHKVKLVFSVVFVALLLVQLIMIVQNGYTGGILSPLGLLIIFCNNIISFILCAYGLKITMGRQSLAKTSYIPDLFKKDHKDILVTAGELKKEEPKYIDLTKER